MNINIKESEMVEFKESLSELKEGGQTLCSFANHKGGVLYFGIKNNGDVLGIQNITSRTLTNITQYLFDNLEPQKIIQIEEELVKDKSLIKITIGKSNTPYHTFRKRPYIRIGNTTKDMPYEEYQDRLLKYKSNNQDSSAMMIPDIKITDLSVDAIRELRQLLTQSGRYEIDINQLTDEQLLKDLLLIRENKITVAALVLLGTEATLSKSFPYVEVRYGYRINEGEIINQDTAIFKGGYLCYYNKIWSKIQSRNITINIPFEMRLIERKAFDEQSIREAINNAIVHRDYFLSESTFVMQYSTKIAIKNPGGFPEGITKENILYESKPRNKLLADILFKCELVEQFGNGVNLMYKNQVSLGKNPPNYDKTTENRVVLELDGNIQDIEFAKYVFRVAISKQKNLNDTELFILNKIKKGQPVKSNDTTKDLLSLGLIEQIGYEKYMLSKQYYLDMDKKGKYTKTKGLTRNKNKELILQHLKDFGTGKKQDFVQIFEYKLTEKQIWTLLNELREEGKIYFDGKMRSPKGVWRLKI